ncbi:potassium uptake TrkH family protein [Murinocardiopsis flavida]|uniref:Potassium uptake TrkH family protein n=2 Tax=Murinocardiopsis flavida TaxID=645275 RepID=A0A2P8D234_9ACTN|nr:potassium uptake TrkH family protein [Murinocardiopsis flavida]
MLAMLRALRSRITSTMRAPRGAPMAHRFAWGRPARLFVLAFAVADAIGTALLMLPIARAEGNHNTFVEALFTSTSALCVAGLAVLDIGAHWSVFGELVILGLIQIGGLGIMTLASVLGMVVIRRFGLKMQLSVQTELRSPNVGDARGVVARIVKTSLAVEGTLAVILTARLWASYDMPLREAAYVGGFHAVSAFNNAGLSLFHDSLTRFAADPVILLPIALATILGGLGFPVLLELRRHLGDRKRWTLHAQLTLAATSLLFVAGAAVVTFLEWSNPATLGPMGWAQRILVGAFHGIMPRSGGFNVVDVGAMDTSTLFVTVMLMFVGGGSAGTAGGIKAATFAVLFLVVWSEIRGHPHVHAFGRRISPGAIRQALSLTFLSMTVVALATVYLLVRTPFETSTVLFEVVSASAVVGLSTGITPDLPPDGHVLLAALMFAGRIGPITFASALALRDRTRRYDLAEARPIIG